MTPSSVTKKVYSLNENRDLHDSPGGRVLGVGTLNLSPRAKALVLEALNANRLSYGPFIRKLEREFAARHSCRYGIMSNSGTSALQIALQAMKELHEWKDEDEVIIPAVTFVATANIVLHNRMRPVPVDVEPIYYGIDPTQIESKITPRTRAIIPVHPFGHPADMDPILAIAQRHRLKVIEDSCETMFAQYNGQSVGSLGDIGCFSTYIAHLLTTGVGGLNITNNPDYAIRLHSLLNHGRDSIYLSIDDDKNKSVEELRMIASRRFSFVSVGHSFRVTEMEAALGLAQLEESEQMLLNRKANARHLSRELSPFESRMQLPKIRQGSDHVFMMYPLVLRDEPKQAVVDFLEQHGVGTRDMLPLINQPVYKNLLGWNEDNYPVAKWINHSGFYIGCHQDITEADRDYIVELFVRCFRPAVAAQAERNLLVLDAAGSTPTVLERILDEVPLELFSRCVAVADPARTDIVSLLKSREIALVPTHAKGALRMVTDGDLPVQEENILFFPANGHYSARDIGKMVIALERGSDMVVASRFLSGGGRQAVYPHQRYRNTGNRLFTMMVNLIFFANVTDTFCTFRAVRRHRLEEAKPTVEGFESYFQLSLRLLRKGWKISEIPAMERFDYTRRDTLRAMWSLFPITRVLLREAGRPRR